MNLENVRDIEMSDYFKTIREPLKETLTEQQKKTDEKQDKIIEQLKGNQLALTSGFKDLIETNKDIITLNRELPQLTYEEEKTSPQQSPLYDLGQDFVKEELDYIKKKFSGSIKITIFIK